MRIGVFHETQTIDELCERVARTKEMGFPSAWVPQIFGFDALTGLAVVAHEISGIDLGTAVVPTYPRHPMALAAQARSVQQVADGRFTLGIGLSHKIVIQDMLGISFARPVDHMREYLEVLLPLLADEGVSFAGDHYTAHVQLTIPASRVPCLVAALGERMLALTGAVADGTATWMTGPATIGSHVAPLIRDAADAAGRPAPKIVSALPVAVTDDPDGARANAAEMFAMYGILPSYRAMLDREGAADPSDVAIVGDEATVRAGIEAMFEAGTTEFVVVPFANSARTLEFVATLL
jgi:5,10-methylenetetrahydromethanopterin reductase